MVPTKLRDRVRTALPRGMGEIASAIRNAKHDEECLLTVSVAPVFSSRWLISRLGSFKVAHLDIELRVNAKLAYVDLATSDIDVCIRSGYGPWPETVGHKLSQEVIYPVCSPRLAKRLSHVHNLFDIPILRDASDPELWSWWCEAMGINADELPAGTAFSDASLCMNAAIAGQGVYLAVDTLVGKQHR